MAEPQGRSLETAEDIQARRDQVLVRYQKFKDAAEQRRAKLQDALRLQQFRRDADELEGWISEKLQTASDEAYKDTTNLQVGVLTSDGARGWALTGINNFQNNLSSSITRLSQTIHDNDHDQPGIGGTPDVVLISK